MKLPFTAEEFYEVFRAYNEAVWPAQLVLVAIALLAVVFALRPRRWAGPAISSILAILWLWLGLAYHLAFFAAINPVAKVFAALSVAGGLVFLWAGVVKRRLDFEIRWNGRGMAGAALVVFALVVYPLWSLQAGHAYPALPTFGLPCPTTIFTIGMLCFAVAPYPRSTLVIPILWSLIGGQAAFLLDVPPDLGLWAGAAVGAGLLVHSLAWRHSGKRA